jgi:hypothetical protein
MLVKTASCSVALRESSWTASLETHHGIRVSLEEGT